MYSVLRDSVCAQGVSGVPVPPLLTPDRGIEQTEKFDTNIILHVAVAAVNCFHPAHRTENIPRASLFAENDHFAGLDIIKPAIRAFAYTALDFFCFVQNTVEVLRFQACYIH